MVLWYWLDRRQRKGGQKDQTPEVQPAASACSEKAADLHSDRAELEGDAIRKQWSELDSKTAQRYELSDEAHLVELRAEGSARQ
jgi:hypothetical protein